MAPPREVVQALNAQFQKPKVDPVRGFFPPVIQCTQQLDRNGWKDAATG